MTNTWYTKLNGTDTQLANSWRMSRAQYRAALAGGLRFKRKPNGAVYMYHTWLADGVVGSLIRIGPDNVVTIESYTTNIVTGRQSTTNCTVVPTLDAAIAAYLRDAAAHKAEYVARQEATRARDMAEARFAHASR